MNLAVTRLDSFSSTDMPDLAMPQPAAAAPKAAHPHSAPAKQLNTLAISKLLADPTRLRIVELCSGGRVYTASSLTKIVRSHPRRLSAHFIRLCQSGLFFRRAGEDQRNIEHGIHPEYLRKDADGTCIVDCGTVCLRFPPQA